MRTSFTIHNAKLKTYLTRFVDLLDIDDSTPKRIGAAIYFAVALFAVFALETHFHIIKNAYWIDHLLFGLGFPAFIYSTSGSWRYAFVMTMSWSLGNELFEDQLRRASYRVDWDHLAADFLGMALTYVLAKKVFKARLP